MDWRLTDGAFKDLTDHTFTRAQVLRIIRELDALAAEANPRDPITVNVCEIRDLPAGNYRLKIQEDGLRCRILFQVKEVIIVWAALPRCPNTYRIAEILFDARKVTA